MYSQPLLPLTILLLLPLQGGTSIEDLAERYPDKIVKIPIDIRTGITDAQAMQVGWARPRGRPRSSQTVQCCWRMRAIAALAYRATI